MLTNDIGVTQLNTISQAEDHRVPVQNYPQLRKSYQGAEKLSGQVEGIKWSTENGRLLTHIFDIVCVSLPISMDIVGLSVPIPFVFAEEPLFQQPVSTTLTFLLLTYGRMLWGGAGDGSKGVFLQERVPSGGRI